MDCPLSSTQTAAVSSSSSEDGVSVGSESLLSEYVGLGWSDFVVRGWIAGFEERGRWCWFVFRDVYC